MARTMRHRLEEEEDLRLAPYAVRSAGATRRHGLKAEGRAFDYRTSFQRDRDRIVYSRAFRRLRQKAQEGILPAYEDHRRNRLTHTLEVVQLARTIGRSLSLNEDLIEAVALGHDLGQPPFGRTGERALDRLLDRCGGFRRAWQGLRVVDHLEKRYEHPGLNLTDPVREGIFKSGEKMEALPEPPDGVRAGLAPWLEIQVVLLADRIATCLSGLDDALQASVVEISRVERLDAVRELKKKLGHRYHPRGGRFMKVNAIHRGLTHMLVTGAILHTSASLGRWAARNGIDGHRRFREISGKAIAGDEVALAPAGSRLLEGIEGFLETRVHRGRKQARVEARGRRVLQGLFTAYHDDPRLLDDHVLLRFKEASGRRFLRDLAGDAVEGEIARHYAGNLRFARILGDHLAGMTDAYAVTEHARLREIGAIPGPAPIRADEESR